MFTYVCTVGIDTGLYSRDVCGSLVPARREGLHADFHARIEKLERANASA